jgi:hypothetical protein
VAQWHVADTCHVPFLPFYLQVSVAGPTVAGIVLTDADATGSSTTSHVRYVPVVCAHGRRVVVAAAGVVVFDNILGKWWGRAKLDFHP